MLKKFLDDYDTKRGILCLWEEVGGQNKTWQLGGSIRPFLSGLQKFSVDSANIQLQKEVAAKFRDEVFINCTAIMTDDKTLKIFNEKVPWLKIPKLH